jgi:hypothetical protein
LYILEKVYSQEKEEIKMCDSYHIQCSCGENSAELFFGKMVLGQSSVVNLFCPRCSSEKEHEGSRFVWDNGWVLELDMDIIRSHSSTFGLSADELTAGWVFDRGYVTWVGITPDDAKTRNREREEIRKLAETDFRGYLHAMKMWGIEREQRFISEGWRKMA